MPRPVGAQTDQVSLIDLPPLHRWTPRNTNRLIHRAVVDGPGDHRRGWTACRNPARQYPGRPPAVSLGQSPRRGCHKRPRSQVWGRPPCPCRGKVDLRTTPPRHCRSALRRGRSGTVVGSKLSGPVTSGALRSKTAQVGSLNKFLGRDPGLTHDDADGPWRWYRARASRCLRSRARP